MNIIEVQRKLEFDKVCDKLKMYCISQYGKEKIDRIELYTSAVLLKIEFTKLTSLKKYIEAGNDLDLEGLRDVREDVERLRIPGNFIQTEKYNWIKSFLRISRIVKSQVKYFPDEEENDNIKKLADGLYADKVLEHSIESTVDNNGEVRDSASRNLKRIREELIEKRENLRKLLSKLLKRVSEEEYTQDDLITLRDGRSVIPVKVENKRKVPGIIHSSSATGYTVFIEPAETIDLNNEITELTFEEKREVERILRNLSESIARYYNELKVNSEILGELDFIRAKALYAIEFNCVEPGFKKDKYLLKNCYHPILIQKLGKNNVTPLNLELIDETNTIVITGPNAGGKTVALKTVGLLQMMYQAGLMVTVEEGSCFRIFSRYFVVIGDEQSIENSLSSFSSHLKELKDVIENSDFNSLVLIDEICSGTDPKFGSALSASILNYLSDKNCFTIVTTHIGDLKIFAHNTDKFINASLEFSFEKLSPSFNFKIGIPGQSYTFELAEKFKIPAEIIEFASSMVVDDQYKIEDMLSELNNSRIEYEGLLKENQIKKKDIDEMANEYNSKLSRIKLKEKEIINNAREEAANILEDGRGIIEKAVKEIKEKEKTVSEIKKEYTEKSKKLLPGKGVQETVSVQLRVGDVVKIKNTSTKGEITEILKELAVINTNGLTLKSPLNKLELISIGDLNRQSDYKIILHEAFETNLDIRGKYVNEIADLLEKFIYEGHINSVEELSIVHGKGTGSLRKAVHEILKSNKFVSSFRLGHWNEGDSGVTIVEIKK
ncbi:MAG: endonuclease MutS2 [Candidatus Kapaibacterium sp.]